MAAVPNQSLTVRDPGLGLAPEAASTFIFFGTSSHGNVNQLQYYSTKGQVLDELGDGPLAESLCYYLTVAGGPAIGVRVDHEGNEGAVTMGTPARVSTSVGTVDVDAVDDPGTPAGPYDAYEGIVEITVSGALGAGEFRYTLDGGTSWSPSLVIPAGGTYLVPHTGLEIEFDDEPAGALKFESGDSFPFSTTANHYDVSALADAMDSVAEATDEFAVAVLCGEEASTSDGATMFAALATHMAGFANGFRYAGALMSAGYPFDADDLLFNTAKSDFANSIDSRIGVTYAGCRLISQKPFVGWGVIRRPLVDVVAGRAGAELISTHLGRFASGSLTGVVNIEYDEFKGGQGMSASKFIVSRTWPGAGGFFINRGNLRSPVGSDFSIWPMRRIADTACDVTVKALQPFMNSKIRVLKDGTGRIDPTAAAKIETQVNKALRAALIEPKDAEGNQGHVAAARYVVDRTNNVQATNRVMGSVVVVPDAYAEEIATDLGFAASAE